MATRVPVLVCGEPLRGDDGVAFAALRQLPSDVLELAEIVEVGQLDVLALLAVAAGTAIVVVDAVSGLPPGEVWVRPLPELAARGGGRASDSARPARNAARPARNAARPARNAARPAPNAARAAPNAARAAPARAQSRPQARPQARSSHELPLDRVLALVATLRGLPPAGTFVGLAGTSWELGAPLSTAAEAAIPAFARAIAEAIRGAAAVRGAATT